MAKLIIHFFFFHVLCSRVLWAKSPELDLLYAQNHQATPLTYNPSFEEYVDDGYQFLTKKVYLLSNTVDSIFTQRSIDDSKNLSYLRFWYEFNKTEGEDFFMRPDFRLRLYLKETRKLLRITFENTSRTQDTQSQLNQTQAANETKNSEKSLAASVGVKLKETDNLRFTTSAGIRLRIPPNLFLRNNFSYTHDFFGWDFSFQNSFFYYSLDGFGNTTNVNFLYKFSELTRGIFETFGTWLEPRDYNAGSGFQLIHAYSDLTTLSAQIGVNGDKSDRLLAVRNYFVSMNMRRLLYKKWFFMEISPIYSWKRENDWKGAASIYFKFEAFLGGNQ